LPNSSAAPRTNSTRLSFGFSSKPCAARRAIRSKRWLAPRATLEVLRFDSFLVFLKHRRWPPARVDNRREIPRLRFARANTARKAKMRETPLGMTAPKRRMRAKAYERPHPCEGGVSYIKNKRAHRGVAFPGRQNRAAVGECEEPARASPRGKRREQAPALHRRRPFARGAWRVGSQVSLPGTACCAPTGKNTGALAARTKCIRQSKRGPSTASRAAQTPREEKSAGLRSG
jgi:hypothetical protein